MDIDFKRIALAILFSVAIIVTWEYFFPSKVASNQVATNINSVAVSQDISSIQTDQENAYNIMQTYEEAISTTARVVIENSKVKGSINLKGALLDDLSLISYKEELSSEETVRLLKPEGTENPYFVQTGWSSNQTQTPSINSIWKASSNTLSKDSPVVLTWENNQGIVFKKTFSIDDKYMVFVKDEIINNTDAQFEVYGYSVVRRLEETNPRAGMIFHEGPLLVNNSELVDFSYKDIRKKTRENTIEAGWFGFSDKYWLVAVSPKDNNFNTRFLNITNAQNQERFQADSLSKPLVLAANSSLSKENLVFVGPKESRTLKAYEKEYGIEKLDAAIDFGMFFFITKPLLKLLLLLNDSIDNFGIAIIVLTILVRLALVPLSLKSHKSMAGLRVLQPRMKELKEKYGTNPQKYNKMLMEEYKKEGVNPLSGCLPILVQIPIFFAIYKVIFMSIEMRQAAFFGYLKDLSVLDPTSVFNLFGLLPYSVPQALTIGFLPLLMGITMFIQQKISMNSITDPMQKRVFMFLPIIFTFLLASFPSGLVLYWVSSNTISIVQQLIFNKFFTPQKAKNI